MNCDQPEGAFMEGLTEARLPDNQPADNANAAHVQHAQVIIPPADV